MNRDEFWRAVALLALAMTHPPETALVVVVVATIIVWTLPKVTP